MKILLFAVLAFLIGTSPLQAQSAGFKVELYSSFHDTLDLTLSLSGSESGTQSGHYGGDLTDSTTVPAFTKPAGMFGDSLMCPLSHSVYAMADYATFRLDTNAGIARNFQITCNMTWIPFNGLGADTWYTINFGDVNLVSTAPQHWELSTANRPAQLDLFSTVQNSLIGPGIMANGSVHQVTQVIDRRFFLGVSVAPSAEVAASRKNANFRFAEGCFLLPNSGTDGFLRIYDLLGRLETEVSVPPNILEIPVPRTLMPGMHIARLNNEALRFDWIR